ncbi:MAG: MBOAT family protein [Candidatus Melainabacteria bacterium]|nr:MBOAT family protein [Candidatus Melainabacteria bacterium]
MLFNSFTYMLFLPAVVLIYWAIPGRYRGSRATLLLVASYIFYMNWKPAYGLLIFALTVINYALGLALEKFAARKKQILIAGLIFNLSCLCFFKYANFILGSIFSGVHGLSALFMPDQADNWTSPALKIILPLGISFFTFEFIHYIVDVYRGSAAVRNFRDFALFAAFFPSQIAGPIKRFQDFTHQLVEKPVFSSANFREGMFLILQGLFKKIVLGDNMGYVVNTGFNHISRMGFVDTWIAVAGFTFQIFFDFSGYTDIGRGSALLLGYKVPENFNWPFLAANLTEFWRRWHISLSTWLRDYLFIPLGGSRVSPARARFNTMLTMVLGGLWHGAAWHYVIWGAFHGAGLVLSKEWTDLAARTPFLSRLRPHPVWHWSGVAFTMLFLFMAGILFRANTIPQALTIAHKLIILDSGGDVTTMFLNSTLPVSLTLYLLYLAARSWLDKAARQESLLNCAYSAARNYFEGSLPTQVVVYASVAFIILGFAPLHVSPFIYFQF